MGLMVRALAILGVAFNAAAQTPQPASSGANPVVSPDGRRVLFSSDRGERGTFFIRNADGSDETRVSTGRATAGRPVWSADGHALLTTNIRNDTLRVLSTPVSGGPTIELAKIAAAGAKAATVASDRSWVVYGAGDWTAMQLFSAPLDGSRAARQITPGGAAFWCHAVSPDAKQVAVVRNDSTRQMQVWVMGIDGATARPVTRFSKAEGNPQCPAWSADGRRLAVQSDGRHPADSTKATGNIWLVDVSTGRATKLAPHDAPYVDELPSWFPDGTRIAFQSNRTGRWEIWVMNTDGTNARQITR